jgi:hypothetical protein
VWSRESDLKWPLFFFQSFYIKEFGMGNADVLNSDLQNDPPQFIPEESRACDLVIQALEPFKHRIQLERVEFVEKRSNLIIKYKGDSF